MNFRANVAEPILDDYDDNALDDAHRRTKRSGTATKVTTNPVQTITVEPLLGFYTTATVLSSLAVQQLDADKACRMNLALNNSACGSSGRDTSVADTLVWKTVLQCTVSGVLAVFAGSWSDRNRKRRPCILIPVVGEFLATVCRLLCYRYYCRLPVEATVVAGTVPAALTGGALTLALSVFSYIGDVTTVKTRTVRIGFVNAFASLGTLVATTLSDFLLPQIGIHGVFMVSLALLVICFVYGVTFVKESERVGPGRNVTWSSSVTCNIKDFFDVAHIKHAVRVTLKTGPNNRRLRIVLLMFMVFVVIGPVQGEMSVMHMFTRVRFGWKEVEFSWFLTYLMIVNVIGTTISVCLFSQYWHINDALVGAMACLSRILSGYVYAFGTTDLVFYLGPIVELISCMAIVALRSIITKLVRPDELGQVTAIFGVCEILVPVIYGPMYTAVYKATWKSTMPGLCFLIGTLSLTPATLIFMWLYMEYKTQEITMSSTEITNEIIKKHTDINEDKFRSYSKLPTN